MKLRRLLQLTSSVAAAIAMTACGGGGETGPAWAQNAKNVITTAPQGPGPVTPVDPTPVTPTPVVPAVWESIGTPPPASYYSTCANLGNFASGINVLTLISESNGVLVFKDEYLYYKGSDCDQGAPAFTSRNPDLTLRSDALTTEPVNGYTVRQVTASRPQGVVVYTPTGENVTVTVVGDEARLSWPELQDPASAETISLDLPVNYAADLYKDLLLSRDGLLNFGNRQSVTTDKYPTRIQGEDFEYTYVPETP